MRSRLIIPLAALLLFSCQKSPYPKKFRLPAILPEVSGLHAASPDSLWWINDSGGTPTLFLTGARGELRDSLAVPGARNRDWEDLAADPAGNIYIGDFGNNANRRQNLVIYVFDPESSSLDSITFRYSDQSSFPPPPERANFDMEAFFWHRDSLHLFSKNRIKKGNDYTKHYVLPARPGDHTAILRDSIYLDKRVVTAAAISPDGQTAALLTYWFNPLFGFIPITPTSLYVLRDFPDSRFLRGEARRVKVPKGLAPTQYESIDFVAPDTVLIASEKTILFKQKARRRALPAAKAVKP